MRRWGKVDEKEEVRSRVVKEGEERRWRESSSNRGG
jgi:hypothetical protein